LLYLRVLTNIELVIIGNISNIIFWRITIFVDAGHSVNHDIHACGPLSVIVHYGLEHLVVEKGVECFIYCLSFRIVLIIMFGEEISKKFGMLC